MGGSQVQRVALRTAHCLPEIKGMHAVGVTGKRPKKSKREAGARPGLTKSW